MPKAKPDDPTDPDTLMRMSRSVGAYLEGSTYRVPRSVLLTEMAPSGRAVFVAGADPLHDVDTARLADEAEAERVARVTSVEPDPAPVTAADRYASLVGVELAIMIAAEEMIAFERRLARTAAADRVAIAEIESQIERRKSAIAQWRGSEVTSAR
jgi:hypothetical protein